MQNFDVEVKQLSELKTSGKSDEIISKITQEFIDRAFYNYQKAKLFVIRGDAYRELVLIALKNIQRGEINKELCDPNKLSFGESCPAAAEPIGAEWTKKDALAEAQKIVQAGGDITYNANKELIDEWCKDGTLTESDCNSNSLKGFNAIGRAIILLGGGWNLETALARAEKLKNEKKVSFNDGEVKEFFEQLREDGVLDELYTTDLIDSAYSAFEQNPDAIDNLIVVIRVKVATSPLYNNQDYETRVASDCNGKEDCQISIGEEIIKLILEEREDDVSEVENIKNEGVAENVECLVLQVAMQESSLQHCENVQENENPLYCDNNPTKVLKGDNGISYGVMQINTLVHKDIPSQNFGLNVFNGASLLFDNYLIMNEKYEKGREYKCNGKIYSGWEGALRLYNGWNTDCTKGNVNYVEEVIAKKDEVAKLFPVCGGALKVTIKTNECVESA